MSFVGRMIAGAWDLPFGGPLGALLDRAARHMPTWHPHGDGESRNGDPRRRVAFTIAAIALGAKMARADGAVTRDEIAAFGEVFQVPPGEEDHARHFGFDSGDYSRIRAHHVGVEEGGSADPHAILGVGRDASLGAIRDAYHRLVRESHPDLAIAQGLPPECIALATARVARINAAYDRLAKRATPPSA